jgi:hypothetical protein
VGQNGGGRIGITEPRDQDWAAPRRFNGTAIGGGNRKPGRRSGFLVVKPMSGRIITPNFRACRPGIAGCAGFSVSRTLTARPKRSTW